MMPDTCRWSSSSWPWHCQQHVTTRDTRYVKQSPQQQAQHAGTGAGRVVLSHPAAYLTRTHQYSQVMAGTVPYTSSPGALYTRTCGTSEGTRAGHGCSTTPVPRDDILAAWNCPGGS
jgi:hypothetical protein